MVGLDEARPGSRGRSAVLVRASPTGARPASGDCVGKPLVYGCVDRNQLQRSIAFIYASKSPSRPSSKRGNSAIGCSPKTKYFIQRLAIRTAPACLLPNVTPPSPNEQKLRRAKTSVDSDPIDPKYPIHTVKVSTLVELSGQNKTQARVSQFPARLPCTVRHDQRKRKRSKRRREKKKKNTLLTKRVESQVLFTRLFNWRCPNLVPSTPIPQKKPVQNLAPFCKTHKNRANPQ